MALTSYGWGIYRCEDRRTFAAGAGISRDRATARARFGIARSAESTTRARTIAKDSITNSVMISDGITRSHASASMRHGERQRPPIDDTCQRPRRKRTPEVLERLLGSALGPVSGRIVSHLHCSWPTFRKRLATRFHSTFSKPRRDLSGRAM